MRDAWDMRLAAAKSDKDAFRKRLSDVERQIDSLLDRIVETDKASLVGAYEAKIEKLERDKIVLIERLEKTIPPKGRLEECIELALKFLSSPWTIYIKMVTSQCARWCSDWRFRNRLGTAKMGCIELPIFHSLSDT